MLRSFRLHNNSSNNNNAYSIWCKHSHSYHPRLNSTTVTKRTISETSHPQTETTLNQEDKKQIQHISPSPKLQLDPKPSHSDNENLAEKPHTQIFFSDRPKALTDEKKPTIPKNTTPPPSSIAKEPKLIIAEKPKAKNQETTKSSKKQQTKVAKPAASSKRTDAAEAKSKGDRTNDILANLFADSSRKELTQTKTEFPEPGGIPIGLRNATRKQPSKAKEKKAVKQPAPAKVATRLKSTNPVQHVTSGKEELVAPETEARTSGKPAPESSEASEEHHFRSNVPIATNISEQPTRTNVTTSTIEKPTDSANETVDSKATDTKPSTTPEDKESLLSKNAAKKARKRAREAEKALEEQRDPSKLGEAKNVGEQTEAAKVETPVVEKQTKSAAPSNATEATSTGTEPVLSKNAAKKARKRAREAAMASEEQQNPSNATETVLTKTSDGAEPVLSKSGARKARKRALEAATALEEQQNPSEITTAKEPAKAAKTSAPHDKEPNAKSAAASSSADRLSVLQAAAESAKRMALEAEKALKDFQNLLGVAGKILGRTDAARQAAPDATKQATRDATKHAPPAASLREQRSTVDEEKSVGQTKEKEEPAVFDDAEASERSKLRHIRRNEEHMRLLKQKALSVSQQPPSEERKQTNPVEASSDRDKPIGSVAREVTNRMSLKLSARENSLKVNLSDWLRGSRSRPGETKEKARERLSFEKGRPVSTKWSPDSSSSQRSQDLWRPKTSRLAVTPKSVITEYIARETKDGPLYQVAVDLGIDPSLVASHGRQFLDLLLNDKIPTLNVSVLEQYLFHNHSTTSPLSTLVPPYWLDYLRAHLDESKLEKVDRIRLTTDLMHPADEYKHARQLDRKIYMHVGPTNSGKTYNALQKYFKAKSGIYCGPLRLLAHEVYEKTNARNVPCQLLTGEEIKDVEGARHVSCTVEMAPKDRTFDIAVVDEIQLVSDPQRGFAWTTAVLGLRAKEIHLCGEASAVPLIEKIAAMLHERVEIVHYERLTPLSVSESIEGDLKRIQPGDCVVAFSRNSIFELKRRIELTPGLRCALVHGGLPAETRATQARHFNDPEGEYNVLVASDAVGLGLNLNIKRIIFHSLRKHNGTHELTASPSLVKQIAGRAGRFNTAHSGGSATTYDERDVDQLKRDLAHAIVPIARAVIQPTSALIEMFASMFPNVLFSNLLQLFQLWSATKSDIFVVSDMEQNASIAMLFDDIKELTLSERYSFSSTPVQYRSDYQCQVFKIIVRRYSCHQTVQIKEIVKDLLEAPAHTEKQFKMLQELHKSIMLYAWLRIPATLTSPQEEILKEKETCERLIDTFLMDSSKQPRKIADAVETVEVDDAEVC